MYLHNVNCDIYNVDILILKINKDTVNILGMSYTTGNK